jgi:hypothetical protein
MRNLNNKSLNDLFRSAQAETEEGNVLLQSEVEQLLQKNKRSVPVTQSIQQKLFERLLSTPLKIGMTAMTTTAILALGIFAFWPQQSTNTVTKNPILSHGTYGSQGTDGATRNFALPPTDKPSFVVSQPSEVLPAIAKIPVTPIATADSLQPTELTPEQLAKLGIVLEDNGDIDFYTKSKVTGEVNKLGLPPTWGVRLHLGEKIADQDLDGVTIPKSAPRLITEPDGAKRLFSFENDTTITQKDGNHSMVMQMQNNVHISPEEEESQALQRTRVAIKTEVDTSNPENVQVNVFLDSMADISKDLKNILSGNVPNGLDSQYCHSLAVALNADVLKGIPIDSLSGFSYVKILGPHDSLSRGSRGNINIAVKSTTSSKNLNTNIELNTKNGSQEQFKRTQVSINSYVDSANHGDAQLDVPLDSMADNVIKLKSMVSQMEASIDLIKLIPIRVRNLKNAAHPNELIFWYEPSPELTAVIPAAVSPVPAVQSKQLAISVYPNPTYGPATIHYELSDAPRAYFSVRNLLGQEVLNGGMTSATTGDANLDLSKLPAGVYLLITTTDNGERDVERVVVTK